jgi:hypothetical protein
MHSVFYATGQLARIRTQPVASTIRPTGAMALTSQEKVFGAILLVTFGTCCALWLMGGQA